MILIEGAVAILETAKYKIVRMGEMYYALINQILENGETEITIKPLKQISELVAVPIRNDE